MKSLEKYAVPSWSEIYRILLTIAFKIYSSGFDPDIIVGVARGGLVPSRILSDLLENPNLATIRTEFYFGTSKAKSAPVLKQKLSTSVEGKKVLIVDDIVESGCSLKLAKEHIVDSGAKDIRTTVLYCKPSCVEKPDYWVRETPLWVVFPWDLKETIRAAFDNSNSTSIVELAKTLKAAGLPKSLVDRFLKEMIGGASCLST